MKTIEQFKDCYKNHVVFVLGSGSSLNYVNPYFFSNKVTVGVNKIYRFFPVDFVVVHHHDIVEDIQKQYPGPIIVSEFDTGVSASGTNCNIDHSNTYVYRHNEQLCLSIDFTDTNKPDRLAIGGTTVVNAISFAEHIGATDIILCGCDGGQLDGQTNFRGYYNYNKSNTNDNQARHCYMSKGLINAIRDHLKEKNINIYSLNPFTDMDFEGHKFELIK